MKLNTKMPLVSVCIPAYNHEQYIAEAIESVIAQSYNNIELIIINDGSQDQTDNIILSFNAKCKKRFLRYEYRKRNNKGISATLNECLNWSSGYFFTTIASDDIILPKKIEYLVSILNNTDDSYAIAFGNALFINDNSEIVSLDSNANVCSYNQEGAYKNFLDFFTKGRNINYRSDEFGTYKSLLSGNYLPAMSYLIKTEIIQEVGGWKINNTIEDWDMWLKIAKKYYFSYLDQPVALYRWHEKNSSKIFTKELLYDKIELLSREKKYAFSINLEESYYNLLIYYMKVVKKYSITKFISLFMRNAIYYKFLKILILKILRLK